MKRKDQFLIVRKILQLLIVARPITLVLRYSAVRIPGNPAPEPESTWQSKRHHGHGIREEEGRKKEKKSNAIHPSKPRGGGAAARATTTKHHSLSLSSLLSVLLTHAPITMQMSSVIKVCPKRRRRREISSLGPNGVTRQLSWAWAGHKLNASGGHHTGKRRRKKRKRGKGKEKEKAGGERLPSLCKSKLLARLESYFRQEELPLVRKCIEILYFLSFFL